MNNYFDTVAQNWDENKKHIHRTAAIAKDLKVIIAKKGYSTALEFGAGTGLLSFEMKDYFSEITLMDNSSAMIKIIEEKISEAEIQHFNPVFFDMEKNDYTAKTFDVIFSQMALHHVVDTEKIISKFYHLLNTGGLLAIADLYEEDGTFHDREFSGHKGFNTDALSEIFSKHGFKQITFNPCFEMQKENPDKSIKLYPIFLLNAMK